MRLSFLKSLRRARRTPRLGAAGRRRVSASGTTARTHSFAPTESVGIPYQHGTPPVPRGSTCTYSAFAGRSSTQRKTSRRRMAALRVAGRDRIECGHAAAPRLRPRRRLGELVFGGVLWRKHNGLRPLQFARRLDDLAWCLGGLLWDSAGGITRVSGAYPSSSSPSPVKFTGSNHWKMLTFRSSIAAHPPRPKPTDKVKETSATRAQPPNWYSPSVSRVSLGA